MRSSSDGGSLAVDDGRAFLADGALVDAVAGLDVLRHAELLDPAVGGRVLAAERRRAHHALAGLVAGRAVRELFVGELLVNLEAAVALVAAARNGSVIVERHPAILNQGLPSAASAARWTWRVASTAASSSSPSITAARMRECSSQSCCARREVLAAKTRLVRSRR